MQLKLAEIIAKKYVDKLAPFCERISIAGSIRRQCKEVNDIEIVCIPKREASDFFGGCLVPIKEFIDEVEKLTRIRGEATGRYTRRSTLEGIDIDLFMVKKENWGLQLAIRTGPASFSHKFLAAGWVRSGLQSSEGMLYTRIDKRVVPVYEEEDLFKMIKEKYIEPEFRLSIGDETINYNYRSVRQG